MGDNRTKSIAINRLIDLMLKKYFVIQKTIEMHIVCWAMCKLCKMYIKSVLQSMKRKILRKKNRYDTNR